MEALALLLSLLSPEAVVEFEDPEFDAPLALPVTESVVSSLCSFFLCFPS